MSLTEFWNTPLFMITGFFKTIATESDVKSGRKKIVDQMRATKQLFGWV